MSRIAFVTDSTAGIPEDLVKQHDITVVPLQVIFGTEAYRDGVDLTQEEFFRLLKAAKTLPTTSQPAVADFEEAYKRLLDDPDVTGIISVHISSKLSGTYSTAVQAAERVGKGSDKEIAVIDTLSAFMGEGLMVVNGVRAAEEGKSQEQVVDLIESMVPKVRVLLLLDTLEYLQKGGRIGGAQAFVGGLMNIKPILQLKDGALEPLERMRTRRKAMERLVEIGADAMGGEPCQVCVGQAEAEEDAQTLSRMMKEKMNVAEEFVSQLSPVICKHTGPGVLGFVYYPLED